MQLLHRGGKRKLEGVFWLFGGLILYPCLPFTWLRKLMELWEFGWLGKPETRESEAGIVQHHRNYSAFINALVPLSTTGRVCPIWGFSLRRERKEWNMCLIFWFSRRLSKELVSVLPDVEYGQGASILWMSWTTENKRVQGRLAAAAPQNLQYCGQTPEITKDYQLLKRKPAAPSYWGYMHRLGEVSTPHQEVL